MLVNMHGNVNHDVAGVITKSANVFLGENQFFSWTPSSKRLELWDEKNEYFNYEFDHDPECKLRKVKSWNQNSIYGFFN